MTQISRRQLFRLKLSGLVRLADKKDKKRGICRPPGAIKEEHFLNQCSHCNDCVKACSYDVIQVMDASYGKGEGTPFLRVDQKACHFCSDFPCISACQTGALSIDLAKEPIALVEVEEENCANSRGIICESCTHSCPEGVNAIKMEGPFGNRVPKINAQDCVGCGLCIKHCDETESRHPLVLKHIRYENFSTGKGKE